MNLFKVPYKPIMTSNRKGLQAIFSIVFAATFLSGTLHMEGAVKNFKAGNWELRVDDACGSVDILRDGAPVVAGSRSVWGIDSLRRDMGSLGRLRATSAHFSDKFGDGTVVTLSGKEGKLKVMQRYYLYPDKDYMLTDFSVSSPEGVELNYMAPVSSCARYEAFSRPGNSILFIPYDNDAWVRYRITPFGEPAPESYEMSAMLNTDTREATVLGSVEHDVWKTGVKLVTYGASAVDSVTVYGGAASALTRDVRPHGAVKGNSVKSPKIMIGRYADWRDGMEAYADLCAIQAPRIASCGERPFGWNSWGKLQTKINYKNASEVAEFIGSLRDDSFLNADSTVYIGLDSFWDFGFNRDELRAFARECHVRGQKAGIYFCPFTDWGKNPEVTVAEAPQYKWKDLYLTHNGEPLSFDGAYAIDPTHPGTKARIRKQIDEFKEWGYDFMKIDFMAHGAYESDRHYDPSVTTGVQAYNHGMAYIDSVADGKLWINLSIAPLFPANYAHSRRIGCDAWADINNTEYSLNALTYGWWLDHVYHYNDADHIVMEGVTDGENRARLTSSAITGLFLLGDDLSTTGEPATRDKVRRTASNPCINEIARKCKSFRPVEPGTGDRATDMFTYDTGKEIYLAVFNFGDRSERKHLPLHRLGLSDGVEYQATELWSRDLLKLRGALDTELPAKDVKVYRIEATARH